MVGQIESIAVSSDISSKVVEEILKEYHDKDQAAGRMFIRRWLAETGLGEEVEGWLKGKREARGEVTKGGEGKK